MMLERILMNDMKTSEITLEGKLHPFSKTTLRIISINFPTSIYWSIKGEFHKKVLSTISNIENAIVIGPEYGYHSSVELINLEDRAYYLEDIKKATCGNGVLAIAGTMLWQNDGNLYNTADVIYNGEIIITYHKMRDGGEDYIAKILGLKHVFGRKLGVFKWGDLIIGIEICSDSGILGENNISNVDVQFLLASGGYVVSMKSLQLGGHIIVNDGSRRSTYYLKQDNARNEYAFYHFPKSFLTP